MLKIVIIDDEFYFRNSLKNSIDWHNFGLALVGDANDGVRGFELIQREKPDIAIVDIDMPRLNGLEMIEKVRESGIACEFILLTGYGEFKYAQKAVYLKISSYLLKPVVMEELEEALKSLSERLVRDKQINDRIYELEQNSYNLMLNDLLTSYINNPDDVKETDIMDHLTELCGEADLILSGYIFFSIHIDDNSLRLAGQSLNKKLTLLSQGYKVIIFRENVENICIIMHQEREEVLSHFLDTLECVFKESDISYGIGISNLHYSIKELRSAYRQANMVLWNRIIHQNSKSWYNQHNKNELYYLEDKTIEKISTALLNKDREVVIKCINEFFENAKVLSYNVVMLNVYNLASIAITTVRKTNPQYNIDSDILGYGKKFNKLDHIKNWLVTIFLDGIEHVKCEDSVNEITTKVEQYIAEHFSEENLSIGDIATNLFLNYSYICYCFKRDKDMTINDYIIKVRMEKAKELFGSGCTNVSLVSEMVGYSSNSYFSKAFKKAIGVTPSEYLQKV